MCLTWDEWSYPQLLLLWRLSDPRIAVSGRPDLGVDHLDMPRTPYWASEVKHSQKPTMAYDLTLTSSSVYYSSHQWNALFLSYYKVT